MFFWTCCRFGKITDTWSALWFEDFLQQLGYDNDPRIKFYFESKVQEFSHLSKMSFFVDSENEIDGGDEDLFEDLATKRDMREDIKNPQFFVGQVFASIVER
ncbi:hypothetical protein ACJX0J_023965 [Zea mays]